METRCVLPVLRMTSNIPVIGGSALWLERQSEKHGFDAAAYTQTDSGTQGSGSLMIAIALFVSFLLT